MPIALYLRLAPFCTLNQRQYKGSSTYNTPHTLDNIADQFNGKKLFINITFAVKKCF